MEQTIWKSPCGNSETARDGAERFVKEFFGTERSIRFTKNVGEFYFLDGYRMYRIACACGWWEVTRLAEITKAGKSRDKARKFSK